MKYLFFDLDTTELSSKTAQLVSLSCLTKRSGRIQTFSEYVLPTCPISAPSTELHGISVWNGRLYVDDEPVDAFMYPAEALAQFLHFVQSMQDFPDEEMVLVAHGAFSIASWVLCSNLVRFDVARRFGDAFLHSVWFADSLLLARLSLPHLGGHSLADLKLYFFGSSEDGPRDSQNDAEGCRAVTVAMAHEVGESMGDFVCNWGKWIALVERLEDCVEQ